MGNLGKQLKRELKTNPKKVGMLAGALGLVAVWFWLPLVMGSSSDPPAATEAAPAATTPAANTVAAAGNATPKSTPTTSWQELAKWIELDPKMLSGNVAELAQTERNPFGPSPSELQRRADQLAEQERKRKAAEQQKQAEEKQVAVVEPTPQNQQLVLSSTLVGGRQRLAVIDGEVYREHDIVKSKAGTKFVLSQVTPEGVVLEYNGKPFPLKLEPDKKDSTVSIRRSGEEPSRQ